ncbi:MAG TPA: hypothetical protein PKC18_17995, partial [Lacipirellulaceae bacterium]|nr:hypothetical protein [Lacipirellulaceae bacterium]
MNKDIQDAYDEAQKLFARAKAIMDEFSGKEMPKDKEEELDRLLDESEAASAKAAKMEERFKKATNIEERHSAYSQPQNRLGASGATQQQAADRDDPKAVAF